MELLHRNLPYIDSLASEVFEDVRGLPPLTRANHEDFNSSHKEDFYSYSVLYKIVSGLVQKIRATLTSLVHCFLTMLNDVPDAKVEIGIGTPSVDFARRRQRIQIQRRLLIHESKIKGCEALVVRQSRVGPPIQEVLGHMDLWKVH